MSVKFSTSLHPPSPRQTLGSRPSGPPSRRRDFWLGRLLPALVFAIFLVDKLVFLPGTLANMRRQASLDAWLLGVNQVLITFYFGVLIVIFTTRLRRLSGLSGTLVIAVSLFGAFSLFGASMLPQVNPRDWLLIPCLALSLVGTAYTLWTLRWLGRSFSILPEARSLVTGGPFSKSRHPLYFGEGLSVISLLLPTISWPGGALLGMFLCAQVMRIRWEEAVLKAEFPEYAAYTRRVPRYLPRPWLSQ
jgi:protein-S-isoprenylcysteine O-methyltransferase Ste14